MKRTAYFGDFHRLDINHISDQQVMLRELTGCWPRSKTESLRQALAAKSLKPNYSTDLVPPCLVRQLVDQYPAVANYGGSIFSRPLTRLRFSRLAAMTRDQHWIQLTGGSQQYEPLETIQERISQTEVIAVEAGRGRDMALLTNGFISRCMAEGAVDLR